MPSVSSGWSRTPLATTSTSYGRTVPSSSMTSSRSIDTESTSCSWKTTPSAADAGAAARSRRAAPCRTGRRADPAGRRGGRRGRRRGSPPRPGRNDGAAGWRSSCRRFRRRGSRSASSPFEYLLFAAQLRGLRPARGSSGAARTSLRTTTRLSSCPQSRSAAAADGAAGRRAREMPSRKGGLTMNRKLFWAVLAIGVALVVDALRHRHCPPRRPRASG